MAWMIYSDQTLPHQMECAGKFHDSDGKQKGGLGDHQRPFSASS